MVPQVPRYEPPRRARLFTTSMASAPVTGRQGSNDPEAVSAMTPAPSTRETAS